MNWLYKGGEPRPAPYLPDHRRSVSFPLVCDCKQLRVAATHNKITLKQEDLS